MSKEPSLGKSKAIFASILENLNDGKDRTFSFHYPSKQSEPGNLMVLDNHGILEPSNQAYDKRVVGASKIILIMTLLLQVTN